MGEQNVTFLGDYADDYEGQVRESEAILDAWVEKQGYTTTSMVVASTLIAFMRVSEGMVDTLRLGNGIKKGGLKGFAMDGLRLLNVTGVAGAGFQRLSRILVVTQRGGYLCSWISTVNGIRRSGQQFFASVADLAAEAGVDLRVINQVLKGTPLSAFRLMEQALGRLGIPYIALRTAKSVQVIPAILKSNPRSVLVFAVRFVRRVKDAKGLEVELRGAHQMIATFSKSAGLVIQDTTGAVYRSLAALQKAYPEAEMLRDFSFVIPNAAIMNIAGMANTAGGLSSVIIQVLPLWSKFADFFADSNFTENFPKYRHKPWEY